MIGWPVDIYDWFGIAVVLGFMLIIWIIERIAQRRKAISDRREK